MIWLYNVYVEESQQKHSGRVW